MVSVIRHLRSASLGAAALVILATSASDTLAASKGTVRIAENDWTGQLVDINLAKIILSEHMGYDVELIFADYTGQWAGLAAGDLDVAMEIWPSITTAPHQKWIDEKKRVEVIGPLGAVATPSGPSAMGIVASRSPAVLKRRIWSAGCSVT